MLPKDEKAKARRALRCAADDRERAQARRKLKEKEKKGER